MEAGIYAFSTLPPVKEPLVLTEWEAGLASKPVRMLWRRENILRLLQELHTIFNSIQFNSIQFILFILSRRGL